MPELLILSTSASTPCRVGSVSAPRRISTMPCTMSSSSFWPAMPSRGWLPTVTVATSETSTGVPSRTASMVLRMSSIERIWPTERTIADCEPMIHRVGADIDVGVVQPVQHLLQREPVGQQPVEIDGDVVGLGLAAPAGDVDHARDRLEAALQDPVLDGLEVGHASSPAGRRRGSGRSRRSGWSATAPAARRWAAAPSCDSRLITICEACW